MDVDPRSVQPRVVGTLFTAQILAGVGLSIGVGVGTLLGEDLGHSVRLAGFTQTALVIGAALFALPLARYAGRHGRRPALAGGYFVGALGAALVAVAAVARSYPLLLFGCLLLGSGSATGLQARYAAADLAADDRRARDLSAVVWAATLGALVTPVILDPAGRAAGAFGMPPLAGPFVATAVTLAGAGVVVGVYLRPDPLILAASGTPLPGGGAHLPGGGAHLPGGGDSSAEVAGSSRSPFAGRPGGIQPSGPSPSLRIALRAAPDSAGIMLALASMASAHVCMIAVMSFTPVQMRHHGAGLSAIGMVIAVHVVGMFGLAPVVGRLTDRLGRIPVTLAGHVIVALAGAVAAFTTGRGAAATSIALLLLGLGWSAVIVAGSALLTESARPADRPTVQGLSDFLISAVGAGGALTGGLVVGAIGFPGLSVAALIVSLILAIAIAAVARVRPLLLAPAAIPGDSGGERAVPVD